MRGHAVTSVKDKGFERLGDVIETVLRRLQPPQEVLIENLRAAWPTLVGPLLAQHTQPVAIARAALVVHVRNHMWLNELRGALEQDVLRAVQSQYAAQIKRITWRVGPLTSEPSIDKESGT